MAGSRTRVFFSTASGVRSGHDFSAIGTAVSRLGGHLAASVLALSMAAAWTNSAAAGEWFWYDPVRFAEDLAAGKTVFGAVHADWCATCAAQAPVMLEVIAEAPV